MGSTEVVVCNHLPNDLRGTREIFLIGVAGLAEEICLLERWSFPTLSDAIAGECCVRGSMDRLW